jgi:nucleoside-diphosphate-sugar epimerase
MTTDIFLFGAGYSLRAFAAGRPDPAIRIAGTTRSSAKASVLRTETIEPFLFDGTALADDLAARLATAQALIVSASPEDDGDPVLAVARQAIETRMPALRWIGYLSTVGVYGGHDGAWIDEDAECRPTSARARRRLDAEAEWQALGARLGVPVAVLRLSGIYGPGRNAFVNLSNGTARRIVKPDQVFNRIHVADIAGSLWHLLEHGLGGVFNVTDDEPAPPQDVVTYAASVMGVEPPPEIAFDEAAMTPMARSFYGENKRVSNARLKAAGYDFRFPDYRVALDALWADGTWQGETGDRRRPLRQT